MDSLAVSLRAHQLIAQNMHNLAKGSSFFADHEFLGSVYEEAASDYDAVVERCIGLGEDIDLGSVGQQAAAMAANVDVSDMSCEEMFAMLLGLERELQAKCSELNGEATLGTQNLLQGIADKSEMRVYKLKRRIM